MSNQELELLLKKFVADEATATDRQLLRQYFSDEQYRSHAKDWMEQRLLGDDDTFSDFDAEEMFEEVMAKSRAIRPVHRTHFLKTAWIRYAAAILIILGIGSYLYITNQIVKPSVTTTTSPVPMQNDALPGGNRATLTLADGSRILLDSVASGQLAREENAIITKTADGRIEYDADEKLGSKILYNTMTTPRGGQYQLTLPDGSQVWLNAASSITYPTAFTGKTREVSISGEAYFEVAKNKSKPFRVTAGNQTIEVLGTHFNINAYPDEQTMNTTLLEGSVRIKTVHTSLKLKPAQQGQLNPKNEKLSLAVNPDLEQVMAWKNGRFNFNKVSLAEAMRQIGRWYDVDVIYEGGKIPDMRFGGKMGKDLKLSQVLNGLQALGVEFKIEGKRLIVTQ